MADFQIAFLRTTEREGGAGKWTNAPLDKGGETYGGISRVFNPNWEGWALIDRCKGSDFEGCLASMRPRLNIMRRAWFKREVWDRLRGDDVPHQGLAELLFDAGTHQGTGDPARMLQRALNILNDGGKHYADVKVDGAIGPNTLTALRLYAIKRDMIVLAEFVNGLLMSDLALTVERDPTQEKWAYGWIRRRAVMRFGG